MVSNDRREDFRRKRERKGDSSDMRERMKEKKGAFCKVQWTGVRASLLVITPYCRNLGFGSEISVWGTA